MSYEIAQQRIAAARAHGSVRLNLSGLGLIALPPEWCAQLGNLQSFSLENNQNKAITCGSARIIWPSTNESCVYQHEGHGSQEPSHVN